MITTYRTLLADPHVRALLLTGLLAKIPDLAIGSVLLLHVVENLGRGFGAASLVSASWMAGSGLGTPMQGHALDRFGLRLVFGVLLLAQAVFWSVAWFLPFPGLLLSGVAYFVLNPPLRSPSELNRPEDEAKPGWRVWLSARMVCALGVTVAVAISTIGFEVAAIGTLKQQAALHWSWLVLAVAAGASIVGGVVYGAMRRPPSVFALAVGLGLLCIPIGLGSSWYWLCLLTIPANLLVAPALSASAGAVSALAPGGSKGVAMGSYGSALLAGNVIGSPLAGFMLDHGGPMAAFAALGGFTIVPAGLARLFDRRYI